MGQKAVQHRETTLFRTVGFVGQFVGLACGLVLAIAGVRLGYLSVRGAAGRWMERWIAAVRGQPLRLVVAGATSAAFLHSSSAVEVMVLALSQAGALALDEALFVIVGANVGTTATAQLVALRLPAAGLILMAGGLVAFVVAGRRPAALAVFSLGAFLSGLQLIGTSTGPLVAERLASLGREGGNPVGRAFWVGWAVTGLVQSSTVVSSS
ncbi:MAG: Na/Pi symporter, partial [Bacillota bacterium]